jgi:hypothetical protein
MVAGKSSGPGHGTTILKNVGTSPEAMMGWITGDPDFHILAGPTPVRSVGGIRATRVVLEVSKTARYGDSTCPADPRCADLFTRRDSSEYWGPGGREEICLDIAAITIDGRTHALHRARCAGWSRGVAGSLHWRNQSSTAYACTQESPQAESNDLRALHRSPSEGSHIAPSSTSGAPSSRLTSRSPDVIAPSA